MPNGTIPLPQQQTSGDPGLEGTSPYFAPGLIWPAGTQYSPGYTGPTSGASPMGAPAPPSPRGNVPVGNNPLAPLISAIQQKQTQMAIAAQMRGGQVPIQTMGAGTTPGLTMNPVKPFQPQPLIDSPTESYGSTRAKGIANLVIGASNVVGQYMNKQQQEKQRVLAVDLERVLNAQQGIQQVQSILNDSNSTPEQKQQAQALLDRNKEIINTMMSDPKKAKQIGKALDINFTDPQANKTPENAALQQAIKTMQTKKQAQQKIQQQLQNPMSQATPVPNAPPGQATPQPIPNAQPGQTGGMVPLDQGYNQPPPPPRRAGTIDTNPNQPAAAQPQAQAQANDYASQLMRNTPQQFFDPRTDPKYQEKMLEMQTELVKAQMTQDNENARFVNQWMLADKKEDWQREEMQTRINDSNARTMAMINAMFDRQEAQQRFTAQETDRRIAAEAAARAADPNKKISDVRALQTGNLADIKRYENDVEVNKAMRDKYQASHKIGQHFWQPTFDDLQSKVSKGTASPDEMEKYSQMKFYNDRIAASEQNLYNTQRQADQINQMLIQAEGGVFGGGQSKSSSKPSPAIEQPAVSPRPSQQTSGQVPVAPQSNGTAQAPASGQVPVPPRLQQGNYP